MQNLQKLTFFCLNWHLLFHLLTADPFWQRLANKCCNFSLFFQSLHLQLVHTTIYNNKQWTLNQNQNARAIYFARQSKNLKTWEDCAAVKVVLQPGFTVQTAAAAAAAWAELCSQASWC